MKKLLLLICALLGLGASGAWAQVTSIEDGAYYYLRWRQATGWYITPPTSADGTFLQSNTAVKAIFRFNRVSENTYTITCMNDGKYVALSSGTTASSNDSDGRITTSNTPYNWTVTAGSTDSSWKIHPSGNTNVSWDPWNSSSYMAAHAITFVNNRNEADVQLMPATASGSPTTILKTDTYYKIDFYNASNGKRYLTTSAGIPSNSQSDENAGLFLLETYSGGYYIKEKSSGKYLYASNLNSVTTDKNGAYVYNSATGVSLGNTTLPTESTSETPSENLDYYKWVLVPVSEKSGKWYIKPSLNTNTALAVNSYTHTYASYY